MIETTTIEYLRGLLRDVPDFPKPGILFKDITPLLKNSEAFKTLVDALKDKAFPFNFEKIVAIESRGFILGAALAFALGKGLVLVRKPGKLPADAISHRYDLEYGSDELCMHSDSLGTGEKALIVDDVLATGGTALAAASLVRKLGAEPVGLVVFLELLALKGANRVLTEGVLRTEAVLKL